MEMTTHEIVRMYKDAADKKKQITILAQMNLCTPEEIRDELIKGGIDARTLPRKRKKPGEKVAETTAVPETTPATKAEPKDTEQALPVFIQRRRTLRWYMSRSRITTTSSTKTQRISECRRGKSTTSPATSGGS